MLAIRMAACYNSTRGTTQLHPSSTGTKRGVVGLQLRHVRSSKGIMESLFRYIDYRRYLRDLYAKLKRETSYFSYRYFSRKAGFSSPVFLKLVMEGKRNLTLDSIERFAKALNLNAKEARYFKHLVLFNQAKTASEKQEHYAVLFSQMNTVMEKQLGREQYDYFVKWYNPVLRELICAFDFGDDYELLARCLLPPIRAHEARQSVELLQRLELVRRLDGGRYERVDNAVAGTADIALMGIRHFNRQMIERALVVLDTVAREERNVFGLTMGVSQSCFDVLVAEMNAFRDRVVTIVNQDRDTERVYQLNLQLFPLSAHPDTVRKKGTKDKAQ
ncbi:MAG: TIGR02147 family protein [Chitinivibrionales bacterium]|nr:TIGR02147 family protein [Chitinivibrionales bacterium]